MTTRKELIERIQAMQLGTQEMLDKAQNDALLIPLNTLFVSASHGCAVWRVSSGADDANSVFVVGLSVCDFCDGFELRPIAEE